MPLQDTNPCSITYEVLCHCEAPLCGAVAISRKGNLVLLDTNFDLFFGVFAKIIAKKNKYYG